MFKNKENTRKYLLIAFIILVLYVIYNIFHIMAPFVISAVLIYLLAPIVTFLSERKIFGRNLPRSMSVIILYILVFSILTLIGMVIFPLLYAEGQKIASELPGQLKNFKDQTLPIYLSKFQTQLDIYGIDVNIKQEFDKMIDSSLESGAQYFEEIPKFIQKFVGGFFSALTSFIAAFIFTAFVLIDLPKIKDFIMKNVSEKYKPDLLDLAFAINRDLNGAIRGQLLICILNGILTTLGMIALKVKFAVTIGLLAGVFSIIPVFGTIFSTVPAMLIAATQSWITSLQVLVFILVIHLIEANLFNPKIMGTSVELHPAIVIFSIFVGEHLFGIPGLLLAVPVVAIVRSILIYIYNRYFVDKEIKPEIPLTLSESITE